jgi:hypothetical protein
MAILRIMLKVLMAGLLPEHHRIMVMEIVIIVQCHKVYQLVKYLLDKKICIFLSQKLFLLYAPLVHHRRLVLDKKNAHLAQLALDVQSLLLNAKRSPTIMP